MRLKGRQARFLLATIACWSMARAYLLWPAPAETMPGLPAFLAPIAPGALRGFVPAAAIAPAFRPAGEIRRGRPAIIADMPDFDWSSGVRAARLAMIELGGGETVSTARMLRHATFAYRPPPEDEAAPVPAPAPAPLFPRQHRPALGVEAQAYLYLRPGGGGATLADRGTLGGSQIAARIAVPLDPHLAVAARAYAPLEHRGAEGAIGIDWHPFPEAPLRLSIERRQRIDRQGRSAWSAYLAGGFYRGGGAGRLQFDGYGQAGIVGARRRDGFIDGGMRIGYRLPERGPPIVIGAGLWGAAQPGVSRVDAGPRAAMTLPIERHSLTLAIEGRFRAAGHSSPGSGVALTLASDF
ncbi:hypothetical protein [Sphingomonas bacterium]|uniref:hypothetical protein n=1 Tax=Sphingomonas bacterium TaxID=1895847 RepID=UPI0015760C41|nr:hypothetical protein [Sphingomonas bacterium]